MKLFLSSTDTGILQSGQAFLKTMFQRDASIIVNWSEGETTGMGLTMNFLAKLLDANVSESAGLYLGELIIKIIQKVNHVLLFGYIVTLAYLHFKFDL